MKTTLICGVHGVGKSSFIEKNTVFNCYSKYSCSELIKNYSGLEFEDKRITDVDGNQNILLKAVNYFVDSEYVLYDGHITLFTKDGTIEIVDWTVFEQLKIQHFILLKASPSIIQERILKRDGTTWINTDLLQKAQDIEESKVLEYSNKINASYEIFYWNELNSIWDKQ